MARSEREDLIDGILYTQEHRSRSVATALVRRLFDLDTDALRRVAKAFNPNSTPDLRRLVDAEISR